MKIVIPDDYERSLADSGQLARLEELGEVAHFTERPRDNEEMAERIAGAEIILTMRFQTDFKNTGLLDAAHKLRFISIWGTRPRAVDMKRAGERGVSVAVTPGGEASSEPLFCPNVVAPTKCFCNTMALGKSGGCGT